MSEQLKDVTPAKPAEAAKLHPAAASAALALAVTSAEQSSAGKSDATQPAATVKMAFAGLPKIGALAVRVERKYAAPAIAVALALALGWAGGSQALSGSRQMSQSLPGWAEAIAGIRQNQEDIVRLAGDVNALKGVIAAFKDSFEQTKADAAAQNRPLLERLDDLERASQDATAKMARGAEAAERTERAVTAPDAKYAALVSRLDAIERPAVDPGRTASVPEPKVAAKHMPVEGWILREVYDGAALVEGRNGRLHEVTPGRTLPRLGRVEAIERRGKTWVVVTSKGIIGPPMRWR